MPNSERPPVVLVTGASRGIGRATALEAARRGFHVIALARTQSALETLDDEIREEGGSASLIAADLTDRKAMGELPRALSARYEALDGLVANAGVLGDLTPVADIQMKMWDETIEVNLTANVRLLAGLEPMLRAAPAGRVVGLTSGAATSFRSFWAPYSASKAALEAVFMSFAAETADTQIRTNLVNPGATRTLMREKAMPGEDPQTLPPPEDIAPLVCDLLSPEETRNGERIDFREWRKG